MKNNYHTIQDKHRFADAVIDLVEDYIKYGNGIDENDGIYVDEYDNVSLISVKEAPDESEFHPIVNLLDFSLGVPEIKFDAGEELTDKYIFVR